MGAVRQNIIRSGAPLSHWLKWLLAAVTESGFPVGSSGSGRWNSRSIKKAGYRHGRCEGWRRKTTL